MAKKSLDFGEFKPEYRVILRNRKRQPLKVTKFKSYDDANAQYESINEHYHIKELIFFDDNGRCKTIKECHM